MRSYLYNRPNFKTEFKCHKVEIKGKRGTVFYFTTIESFIQKGDLVSLKSCHTPLSFKARDEFNSSIPPIEFWSHTVDFISPPRSLTNLVSLLNHLFQKNQPEWCIQVQQVMSGVTWISLLNKSKSKPSQCVRPWIWTSRGSSSLSSCPLTRPLLLQLLKSNTNILQATQIPTDDPNIPAEVQDLPQSIEFPVDNAKPALAGNLRVLCWSLRHEVFGSFTMNKGRLLQSPHSLDPTNCVRNLALLKMTGLKRWASLTRHVHTSFSLRKNYPLKKSL